VPQIEECIRSDDVVVFEAAISQAPVALGGLRIGPEASQVSKQQSFLILHQWQNQISLPQPAMRRMTGTHLGVRLPEVLSI